MLSSLTSDQHWPTRPTLIWQTFAFLVAWSDLLFAACDLRLRLLSIRGEKFGQREDKNMDYRRYRQPFCPARKLISKHWHKLFALPRLWTQTLPITVQTQRALGRDYNCDSTTIRLRSDYDVSRAPASNSTQAKNEHIKSYRVVSQSNRNCDIGLSRRTALWLPLVSSLNATFCYYWIVSPRSAQIRRDSHQKRFLHTESAKRTACGPFCCNHGDSTQRQVRGSGPSPVLT